MLQKSEKFGTVIPFDEKGSNPLASAIFAGLAWHEWYEGRGMRDLGLAYKAARRLNRKHWHEWSEGLQ